MAKGWAVFFQDIVNHRGVQYWQKLYCDIFWHFINNNNDKTNIYFQ